MTQTQIAVQREWLALQPGDTLALRGATGTRLQLATATPGDARVRVWLTEEGQPDDVFLHPGDSYAVRGGGRVLLTVWLGTARLRLQTSAATGTRARRPALGRLEFA